MPHRGNIRPYILECDAVGVHRVPVAAVILHFAATMPTGEDGRPNAIEGFGLALAVVKQAVMARVKAARYWQAGAYLNRYPVPEFESLLVEEGPQQHVPFWEVVEEEGATGFKDAHTFCEPFAAPIYIVLVGQIVVGVFPVLFADVKRWVRENRVHHFVFEKRKYLHAIRRVERAQRCDVKRCGAGGLQERSNVELVIRPFQECLARGHMVRIVIISPKTGRRQLGWAAWGVVLNRNALDLVERNLILPPVVELGRPRALVVGDVLRGFKRAVVLQVRGDAGRPEGVVPDPGLDAGATRASLDHAVGVLLPHRLAGELAGLSGRRLEQRRVRFSRNAGGDVFVEVLLQIVVTRDLVFLATIFVQADPSATTRSTSPASENLSSTKYLQL